MSIQCHVIGFNFLIENYDIIDNFGSFGSFFFFLCDQFLLMWFLRYAIPKTKKQTKKETKKQKTTKKQMEKIVKCSCYTHNTSNYSRDLALI